MANPSLIAYFSGTFTNNKEYMTLSEVDDGNILPLKLGSSPWHQLGLLYTIQSCNN